MKFIIITFFLLAAFFIGIFVYTQSIRVDILECQRTTRAQLSNLDYRYTPSLKECANGKNAVEQLNSCVSDARSEYDENIQNVHDEIVNIAGPLIEDPQDFIDVHNEICKDYPESQVN